MLDPLPGIGRDDIESGTRSIWRYRAALPSALLTPVSLGEGFTPLVEVPWGRVKVICKLDFISPTGSFKDKGASVLISHLKRLGVPSISEDSSGNAGAAIAAYGAAGELSVRIFTPSTTSPSKILQMRIFGADVQLVPGARDESQAEAIRQSSQTFYAGHNWHPFFLQGTKLTAYELWEQLNFRAPDNVVIPTGAGSNVLGCDIGFSELLAAGQIRKRPRLIGVQPRNCAPIVAAFDSHAGKKVEEHFAPTMAEGASIRRPVRLAEVLAAIHRSGGRMISVDEDEIKQGWYRLAELGLFVEPTSALSVAALNRLIADRYIASRESTVVLLTGTGLKALDFLAKHPGAHDR
jgi:threonine synthase